MISSCTFLVAVAVKASKGVLGKLSFCMRNVSNSAPTATQVPMSTRISGVRDANEHSWVLALTLPIFL